MSTEARIFHMEQQAEQLNHQVKLLKQLITTEVVDLRKTLEQQVAEVRQVVMYQDRIYQERIGKLEQRIQQLSEFCLQMARSKGYTGSSNDMIALDMVTLSPLNNEAAKSNLPLADTNVTSLNDDDDDDDDDNHVKNKGVEGVIEKYKDKINSIYDYYTTSNIDAFHPTMDLSHFTRFVKDCQLCGISKGTSAELLWMAVMRSLKMKQDKHRSDTQMRNRNISLGHTMSIKQKKKLFAYQRLESIPKHLFGEALSALAMEKRRQKQLADGTVLSDTLMNSSLNEKPEDIFITFLMYHIFPYVDAVMEDKRTSRNSISTFGQDFNATGIDISHMTESASIHEYKTDAVKAVVREYLGKIKESFSSAIKATRGYQSTTMNLDSFVEIARRCELLPLIRKPDLRYIFLACSAIEKEKHPEAEEGTITVGTFLLALYHLADRIYGDSLMASKYPTAETRMKKLLTKMYVLN